MPTITLTPTTIKFDAKPLYEKPLSGLIESVGKLHTLGCVRINDTAHDVLNADAESIDLLRSMATTSRMVITGGIAAIGELMTIAAANRDMEISQSTVFDIGWLIKELSQLLEPLNCLEDVFSKAKPYE